ncbi:MAG: metallophosphoesterase [Candidatus Sumerlaeota bacterium]|nr:metallophosphoesterase [Candidatus Sumerlaeota bacterium]
MGIRYMNALMALLAWMAVFQSGATRCEAQIERVWLSHRSNDPSRMVVNWETATSGASAVRYGLGASYGESAEIAESVMLHHVEIPLSDKPGVVHYSVMTGAHASPDAAFKTYQGDVLRVAVAADWQGRPKLDALLKDDIHLLLTAGDNINDLHSRARPGTKDNLQPYRALIDAYPELFRSVPFMPALGNHDREIRPRGDKPPAEPVYDVDATAFRMFFDLPDDEWKWHFDVPAFGVRFIALDFNHISDQGTTWQTCHPLKKDSAQFAWYRDLMARGGQKFVITLYNERNSDMRGQEKGEWGRMFQKGTAAITGFGYFAERAEVNGFPYFNTSLSGKGAKYPDPASKFFQGEDSYILLTFRNGPAQMTVEIKSLDGSVMDRTMWPASQSKN